jgi:uroporphyrinogen-III synthase
VDVAELRRKFPTMRFVSIGPQTTDAAQSRKIEIAVEAEVHTIPGMVEAIVKLATSS